MDLGKSYVCLGGKSGDFFVPCIACCRATGMKGLFLLINKRLLSRRLTEINAPEKDRGSKARSDTSDFCPGCIRNTFVPCGL